MPEKRRIDIAGFHNRVALQRGQASVFVIVLVVVVLVGILVLFNTGQLTRQKVEVQNAADAAAYSAGILRARTLNFMAYTNRAMVANEMAIGQFSAFAAWRAKYGLAAKGLTPSLIGLGSTPVGRFIVSLITAPMKVLNAINDGGKLPIFGSIPGIGTVGAVIGQGLSQLNWALNMVYGAAQFMVRVSGLVAQAETIPKLIDTNAPGARLSNFGAFALALSIYEQERFAVFAGPNVPRGKEQYRNGGMRRYIALVNDSRDTWTVNRERDDLRTPPLSFKTPVIPGLVELVFDKFGFGYSMYGGTELRIVGSLKNAPGWSSADTIKFGANGRVVMRINTIVDGWRTVPVPIANIASLSLGGASQERVVRRGSALGFGNFKGWNVPNLYGQPSAGGNVRLALLDAINPRPFGGYQPRSVHRGLANFHHIDPERYPSMTASPVILIGVRKDLDSLETSDQLPPERQLGGGRFQLNTIVAANTPDAVENDLAAAARTRLREILNETLQSGVEGVNDLPAPFNSFIDVESMVDELVNTVTGTLNPAINYLLDPLDQGEGRSAMFSVSAAQVYYRNPENETELGSLFNPYWEVRLQALDDNVRKWALVTQDPAFRSIVAYLIRTNPDETGLYHDMQYLGEEAR